MRAIALALLMSHSAAAVIVDRVAVSVGNSVITSSEIRERILLAAFQNGARPADDSAAWKTAAEELIDQKIVQREMQVGRYASLEEEDTDKLIEVYRKEHYRTEAEMMATLRNAGLTADQLRRDLERQADLLNFLNLRFRPAVQVTDDDIEKFYLDRFAAAKLIPLEQARASIEETLTNERADKELDAWLKDQRKRLRIEYHADAFPPKIDALASKAKQKP